MLMLVSLSDNTFGQPGKRHDLRYFGSSALATRAAVVELVRTSAGHALADVVGELGIIRSRVLSACVAARLARRAATGFAGIRIDQAVSTLLLRRTLRAACVPVAACFRVDGRVDAAVRATGDGYKALEHAYPDVCVQTLADLAPNDC